MKCILPIDCVLALTYRCNSRCTMCDIWKMKDFKELPVGEYAKLPNSLRDINLSGGEPFLRTDLPEIVRIIVGACPRARIVISSNGFATELIIKQMKEILKIKPDIGVAISIDGIGAMHDELRGIPGGFDKAITTIKELKKLGMTNLRLAFTLMNKNVLHMSRVYDLSHDLGVQFTHSFAQSSEFYFGGKKNVGENPRGDLLDKEYDYLIKNELKSWNVKRWLRAYYAFGMYRFIVGKEQVLSNAPGRDFFFVDPAGDIYPSVVHNVVMGNIQGTDFQELWCSPETEEKRKKVDDMKVPVWMICTARTAIKKHPLKVGWWILKRKFF